MMPGLQLPLTAFILGSIWGMLWMVLSGLLMMMVGGIIFAPPAGLAAWLWACYLADAEHVSSGICRGDDICSCPCRQNGPFWSFAF